MTITTDMHPNVIDFNAARSARAQDAGADKARAKPLGRDRKSVVLNPEEDSKSAKSKRFKLQEHAVHLLPKESVRWCCKAFAHDADGNRRRSVEVKSGPHGSSYSGLARCGSVWHCPVCTARISQLRAGELEQALRIHLNPALVRIEQQTVVLMLTLTARHKRSTRLAWFLPAFLAAEKRMKQRKIWRRLRSNVIGTIKALEVTHGEANGWHPHSHTLFFFEGLSEAEAMAMLEALRRTWEACLESEGLSCNRNGFQVQNADKVKNYIAKFGCNPKDPEGLWGVSQDMTLACHKNARFKGRNPWQLLADSRDNNDRRASRLFQEYAEVFKGRRQLTWSPGLKARFAIGVVTDEEAAAEKKEDGGETIAVINEQEWYEVIRSGQRGAVLEAADEFGAAGVRNVLKKASRISRDREELWRDMRRRRQLAA